MKVEYEANDKKKGMSLAEVNVALANAAGLAKVNEKPLENCKVTVFVNLSAGIKQLIVEV